MNKGNKLLRIIDNKSFELVKKIMESAPYNCSVNEEGNLYLIKYNQIRSDFSNKAVRQSRGIILEKETNKIVCWPFDKFFNYGEKYAAKIDWTSARVQEKIDGSIIKVFYYNGWKVATNGTIDAYKAEITNGSKYKTFGDLFNEAEKGLNLFNKLDPEYTYIFELVSPWNRVVVPYKEIKIFHIGTRNNKIGQEVTTDIGVSKPKEYSFSSLEDVIAMTEHMSYDQEGYVVVDKNWNRVKVKSPAYLAVHKLSNNGVITRERVIELIITNETDEFLTYFPEYSEMINDMRKLFAAFKKQVMRDLVAIAESKPETRKEYAMKAKESVWPSFMFAVYDRKTLNFEEFISDFSPKKIEELLYQFKKKIDKHN